MALELLQKTNPKSPRSEISDLYCEKTCEVVLTPQKSSFAPEEISGRSTEFPEEQNSDSSKYLTPGLDEIFRTSLCADVRQMEDRWRQSVDGRTSIVTDLSNFAKASSFGEQPSGLNFSNEEFVAAEKDLSRLEKDEKEWEQEFAIIPTVDSEPEVELRLPKQVEKVKQNAKNYQTYDEISGYLPEINRSMQELSIGQFFQAHSDDIYKIIPNKSPPQRKGVPLVDETISEKENLNPMDSQTALKLGNLLDGTETPMTFMKKYEMAQKLPKPANVTRTMTPKKPLGMSNLKATGETFHKI